MGKFELGQIVTTPGAMNAIDLLQMTRLLARHASGDWGDLSEEDKKENEFSLANGFRIMSSYKVNDVKIWVITESDRSCTTILLPSEY